MSPGYVPSRDYLETAWRTFAASRPGMSPVPPAHFVDFVQELVEQMPEPEPEVEHEIETVYETQYVEASHIAIEELLHDLDQPGADKHAIIENWLIALQT